MTSGVRILRLLTLLPVGIAAYNFVVLRHYLRSAAWKLIALGFVALFAGVLYRVFREIASLSWAIWLLLSMSIVAVGSAVLRRNIIETLDRLKNPDKYRRNPQ